MLGYKVPAPDEAMLISGGKQRGEGSGGQFRIVTGHGAWVMPFFRKVRFLKLETHTVDFSESCFTNHGIKVNVSAVVAFKVDNSPSAITAAAQRFLNDQKKGQMEELTRKIFVGHLRGIVGRMTVEEIIQKRELLTEEVLTGSQPEMSAMGLHVDSMQIETFDDADGSYITDMAKPQRAAIDQAANVAQAQADQASQAAQQESLRKQAQQVRDTELAKAQYKAEVDKQQAEAAQAGPLAEAAAQQAVIDARGEVAERNAALRERELVAEVIKPADAERQQVLIRAEAARDAAQAAAKQAEFEAEGAKTRTVHAAEAAAEQVRLSAEAERDAATFNAEAIRAKGQADADAGKAKADATKAQLLAEAAGALEKAKALAEHNGAQLQLEAIKIQPEVARAIAEGMALNKADITLFNGAEGLTQLMAAAIPVVKTVLESFRPSANGHQTTENGEGGGETLSVAAAATELQRSRS